MNSKSILETLNTLTRYVIRSFYPELFIVVNEMLRNTEFVQAEIIAKRLNLSEQTVNKSLNELRQKRFVHRITYKELVFWGFDYHSFVNIVRFKVAMIKQKEAEKSGNVKGGAASGDYVCLKCGRDMTWTTFVKLASSGTGDPVCQSRGCGGKLQKESKRAAEGLKPLEIITKSLQRLEGQEIPTLGNRTMNATIEEAARKEDEMRPDGDPVYEMPVLGSAKTNYVVQLADSANVAGRNLVPPELQALVPESSASSRKPAPPPWLLPAVEEEALVGAATSKVAPLTERKSPENAVVELHVRATPLTEAMHVYPTQLVKQLECPSLCHVEQEDVIWDLKQRPVPLVSVGGKQIPMNELMNEHILGMTTDEYQSYFDVYQEECDARLKSLLM